jgi:hypothetical protein
MREPKLLLNNDLAGKPEGICLSCGFIQGWRSATPVVTVRCSSTPTPAVEPRWRCWYYTTTLCASMPAARPGPAGQQGGDFSADPVRGGKGEALDRHQHENDWKRIFAGAAK